MSGRVLDLHRAEDAYRRVTARGERGAKQWGDYRTIALKLPVMVHNEGLVPALHFVAARSKPEQRKILDDLAEDLHAAGLLEAPRRDALLSWCRKLSAAELRLQQREVLRRLGWYKRIAQAMGKDGQGLKGEDR